jgi:YHS domain-containing protein
MFDQRKLVLAALLAFTVVATSPAGLFAADPAVKVKKVDPNSVCMVMDHTYAKPQAPVVIEGKTYHTYCNICRGKLQSDPATRTAIDPVTHRKVDKAKAVLGATAAGDVLYFESDKTLAQYNGQKK